MFSSLATAIFHNHDNVAQVLVSKTAMPIDFQGNTGNTALIFAAEWGQLASVQFLLENQADATLKNANGDTALSLAMKNGHRDIATLLRSYGAQ